MNDKKEQICRLCLKLQKNGFQGIDETIKQLFNILLLKMDLDKTRCPIICEDCMEIVKKCLYFKSKCMDAEKIVLSIPTGAIQSKYNIKVIYAKKEHIEIVNDEDLDICRFCLTPRLERNNFITLDTFDNDTVFEMLTKYMPEMDFKFTDNPIICTSCRDSLDGYFQFLLNCLDTEDTIKTYCREQKSDNMGLVKLDNIHFLFTNIVEYPVKHQQIHKIKEESNRLQDTEFVYPETYSGLIKQEEFDIKEEEFKLNEDMSESYMVPLNIREPNINEYNYQQKVQGDIMEDGRNNVDDLEDKSNDSSHIQINRHVNPEGIVSIPEGVSETGTYRDSCVYRGKQKTNINGQRSVHNDVSEIKMYKCSLCAYKAKRKYHLKTHMLVHRDISEIKWHTCSMCDYETKYKGDLKMHMVVHKDVSEIKMFKCSFCAYEAKRKCSLKNHMLAHKDVSEIEMFKCSLCTYETKQKYHLTIHMMVHKDITEIKMYRCSLCAYEGKTKGGLNYHMLVHHKDVSDIQNFKCSLCTYEAKLKYLLTRHMLVHKDVSERQKFKCSSCTYEAKHKSHLIRHMVVHKDISETEMYKCPLCAFQTKHKRNVKQHMLNRTCCKQKCVVNK